jgi:hypothetical protein
MPWRQDSCKRYVLRGDGETGTVTYSCPCLRLRFADRRAHCSRGAGSPRTRQHSPPNTVQDRLWYTTGGTAMQLAPDRWVYT